MPRTKTRRRPVPRRTQQQPRPSRKEVKVLIPGHARGAEAFLLLRRKAGRWSITDHFRGAPAFVGAGEVWRGLEPGTADADLYCWSEQQARALADRFVQQAVQIHLNTLGRARRIESLAADMAPPEVMPQVLTLEQVAARIQQATAEVAARMAAHAPEPAAGFTVPAAMDRPDWQPPTPDPQPDPRLLSRKAMDIAANCDDETVGLPLLRVHGAAVTAVLPVVAQYPPMPDVPPTVHLRHLTEAHPDTGKRISERVAAALTH